jgi:hypothetical protein
MSNILYVDKLYTVKVCLKYFLRYSYVLLLYSLTG